VSPVASPVAPPLTFSATSIEAPGAPPSTFLQHQQQLQWIL